MLAKIPIKDTGFPCYWRKSTTWYTIILNLVKSAYATLTSNTKTIKNYWIGMIMYLKEELQEGIIEKV